MKCPEPQQMLGLKVMGKKGLDAYDIDGVVYTSIDKAGVWEFSLVKELKACGYDVDANRIM